MLLNCRVINPAFEVHAIEIDERKHGNVYSAVDSVLGPISDVYLSDAFALI
jgi:hypothetical protein